MEELFFFLHRMHCRPWVSGVQRLSTWAIKEGNLWARVTQAGGQRRSEVCTGSTRMKRRPCLDRRQGETMLIYNRLIGNSRVLHLNHQPQGPGNVGGWSGVTRGDQSQWWPCWCCPCRWDSGCGLGLCCGSCSCDCLTNKLHTHTHDRPEAKRRTTLLQQRESA